MTQIIVSKVVTVEPTPLSLTTSAPSGAEQPPSERRERGPLPLTADFKITISKEHKQ